MENVSRTLEVMAKSSEPVALIDEGRAAVLWHSYRLLRGNVAKSRLAPILTAPDGNAKIALNSLPTYSLTLSEARTAGVNSCSHSTIECESLCVMENGHGGMPAARAARDARTLFLLRSPDAAYSLIASELRKGLAKYRRKGFPRIACRLNAASDIRHERIAPWLFDMFADTVTFYDYTKWPERGRRALPANYSLTYSYSELWANAKGEAKVRRYLAEGEGVAMVIAAPKHALPAMWRGIPVMDGDVTDYRPADRAGHITGLAAKGKAKRRPYSPFVVVPSAADFAAGIAQ